MKKYKFLIIAGVLVAVVAIYYVACSAMAVSRQAEKSNELYWSKADKEDLKEKEELHRVPGYTGLLKNKGLLDAIVKMSASDSIGLFLNLPDSVAQLMVKGVGIRNIHIEKVKLSPFFSKIDPEVLYELFAEPMKITFSRATIAKEPINVVQAPKDSSDVIPKVQPDTSNTEPVLFILNTDKNIRLYFYQTEGGFKDNWTAFKFGLADRWEYLKNSIGDIFSFKVPGYVPVIRIGIRKEDAKVLYRALPFQGQIVVTL